MAVEQLAQPPATCPCAIWAVRVEVTHVSPCLQLGGPRHGVLGTSPAWCIAPTLPAGMLPPRRAAQATCVALSPLSPASLGVPEGLSWGPSVPI